MYYIALGEAFNKEYFDNKGVVKDLDIIRDTDFFTHDENEDSVVDLLHKAMGHSEFTTLSREEYNHYLNLL